jgi:hypothetical protein
VGSQGPGVYLYIGKQAGIATNVIWGWGSYERWKKQKEKKLLNLKEAKGKIKEMGS